MIKFFKTYIILFFTLITSTSFAQDTLKVIDINEPIRVRKKTIIVGLDFQKKEIKNKFEFSNSKFNNTAAINFTKTKFRKEVKFSYNIIDSKADFEYSQYDLIADFSNSKFNNTTHFKNTTFRDIVDFTEVEFNNNTDFSNVKFASQAYFINARFNAEIDFTNVILPDTLDFTNAKINNEIDLTSSKFGSTGICNINLVGATITNIRFRYKRFKLYFDEDVDYELKASVYEALLNKQSNEGFNDSYEKLDKEYKEFKYTDPGYGHGKLGVFQNWVDKYWWGYGYNKERIVLNSILLYLLFAFLNTFYLKHLTDKVYESEKINEYWQETKSKQFVLFFKSIPFSLFYTAQIFFGYKFDMDKLNYKENLQGWKIFNLLYFFIIYISGLACLAYLMNYVITV